MVDRIACFLTCGYTEAGAMQAFLKKLNNKFDYKQYLPNKTIKKKGTSKTISRDLSGLTGEALLEKIYTIIEKHSDEIAKCKAIIIEDDLDGKFHNKTKEFVEKYIAEIKSRIYAILNNQIPIFILYASPEIESWFIADWEHGFGYVYGKSGCVQDIEIYAKKFFVYHLRQYVNTYILKQYVDNIEEYGYFGKTYYKLSDQLIKAIQEDAKKYIFNLPNTNKEYAKQILDSRELYYSKKVHGDRMLRNLDPIILNDKCRCYYSHFYQAVSKFE